MAKDQGQVGIRGGSVIVGCGTGRSGTVNLAYLLRRNGVWATHELRPLLPWRVDEDLLAQRIAYFRGAPKPVADVAFYYLPYLPALLRAFPGLRVVVLRRDRAATVASYERKAGRRNHWMNHDGSYWLPDPVWDPCYPKFNASSRREAIERYWDLYYFEAGRLAREDPDRVRIFPVEVFDTEAGQRELLTFCGVEPRWLAAPLRLNVGSEGHNEVADLQYPPLALAKGEEKKGEQV